MRIRNRKAALSCKALIALCGWAGIALQCGVFSGRVDFSSLRYYTLLSNLLISLYFTWAFVCAARGREAPLSPNVKGALTMGITVTGVVFHTMLSGAGFSMGGSAAVANQLLHTATPILTVLDWLLFDEKGRYDRLSPVKWTLLPNLDFVLATAYGFLSLGRFYDGSRFPYFFINFDTQGVGGVLLYVLALNAAFIALGYAFYGIDLAMAKRAAALRA